MKRRILALMFCVSLAAVSVTGCGETVSEDVVEEAAEDVVEEATEDVVEEAVEEEAVEEEEAEEAEDADEIEYVDASEIDNVIDFFAGTEWVDDAGTIYSLDEDGETLHMTVKGDEKQYEGTYAFGVNGWGSVSFSFRIPEDDDMEVLGNLISYAEDAFEFENSFTSERMVFKSTAAAN